MSDDSRLWLSFDTGFGKLAFCGCILIAAFSFPLALHFKSMHGTGTGRGALAINFFGVLHSLQVDQSKGGSKGGEESEGQLEELEEHLPLKSVLHLGCGQENEISLSNSP